MGETRLIPAPASEETSHALNPYSTPTKEGQSHLQGGNAWENNPKANIKVPSLDQGTLSK